MEKRIYFISASYSEKKSYFAIKQILEILIKNNCFSFVSVIKFLGRNDDIILSGKRIYISF